MGLGENNTLASWILCSSKFLRGYISVRLFSSQMDTPTDATLWAKCNRRDLLPVSLFVPWPPSVELLHLASSLIANARQCPYIDQNWFPARAILITTPSEALLSGKPDTAMMQKDWRADISLDILPPPDNRFIAASCCLMRGDRVVSRLDKPATMSIRSLDVAAVYWWCIGAMSIRSLIWLTVTLWYDNTFDHLGVIPWVIPYIAYLRIPLVPLYCIHLQCEDMFASELSSQSF